MLYALGFDAIAVVAADLYFVNPRPEPGQEGPEQGVRVEVRVLERGELPGSVYSAQPLAVGRPLWRADLLESVDRPGTLDRAHHHSRFRGWEPGPRVFDDALTADPVGWVGARLGDLDGLLAGAAAAVDDAARSDAPAVAEVVPDIVAAVERLLARARAVVGAAAARPAVPIVGGARHGWL